MVSDETFFAWLDGELDAGEAARVEAEVAANPRLSGMAAEHRAMQARLKGAFDPVLDAPLPEQLLGAIGNPPEAHVIDLSEARNRRDARRWPSIPQWGAMAASLAVGVLVGTVLSPQREDAPVTVEGGTIYAASSLNDSLNSELASAPVGNTRIGITFRDRAGAVCRSFMSEATSGLACRDDKKWRLRGLFAAPEGQSSDYRMAGGMDPNLAALVDSTMSGEPMDAAKERAAKENGWR